jgi:hypothetical protein
VQEFPAAKAQMSKNNAGHFTRSMQTEAKWAVNTLRFPNEARRRPDSGALDLRATLRAGRFRFRQGLWIEDLQTPPGQECSNGSMILLAVVLWRAFSSW